MSLLSRLRVLAFSLLALVALERSSAITAAASEPQAGVSVCGTPVPPGSEAVAITAPMGAGYVVTYTNELGQDSLVASGMVGPTGSAFVMAPAVGVTPIGACFITVRVMFAGQLSVVIIDSTDPLFLWQ